MSAATGDSNVDAPLLSANGRSDDASGNGAPRQPMEISLKPQAKKTNLFSLTEDAATKVRTMQGYQRSGWGEAFHWSLAVVTAFMWVLIAHWFPRLGYGVRYKKTPLRAAEFVLVEVDDATNSLEFCPVVRLERKPHFHAARQCKCGPRPEAEMPPLAERMILFRHRRYVFDKQHDEFEMLEYPKEERASVIRKRVQAGTSFVAKSPLYLAPNRSLPA